MVLFPVSANWLWDRTEAFMALLDSEGPGVAQAEILLKVAE